ncbi:MAG: response regulator transcription factor [Candidatus Sumerlaeaceae bacterium]
MTEKKKILAVDDESDVLLILKTALISEGYQVFTATNGPDAIALAREHTPDLMVLDMMMPDMNGFETLRHIRDGSATQGVPVIMLTGVSDKDKIRQALDLGIDYYIVKPFEFHDLIAKVKLAISDSSRPPI